MKYLLLSFLAGVIYGVGSIIMKILVGGKEIMALISDPIFLAVAASGVIGFFLFQKSLTKERVSHASLVCTSSSTLLPIIGGFLLGEVISLTELVGIVMITLSVIILTLKSLEGSRKY